jgi:hypothetical protein
MMSAEPDMGSDDEWDGRASDSPERIRTTVREMRAETEEPAARKSSKAVERSSPDAGTMQRRKLVARPSVHKDLAVKASPSESAPSQPSSGGDGQSRPGGLHRAATAHKGP